MLASRHRARLMLHFFISATHGHKRCIPEPSQIDQATLLRCVRPFFQRMEARGAAAEMREWVANLERDFPGLAAQLWPHIDG